jgi:hypothetical protein
VPKTVNGCYLTAHGPGNKYKRPVDGELTAILGRWHTSKYFGARISKVEAERRARLLMVADDVIERAARNPDCPEALVQAQAERAALAHLLDETVDVIECRAVAGTRLIAIADKITRHAPEPVSDELLPNKKSFVAPFAALPPRQPRAQTRPGMITAPLKDTGKWRCGFGYTKGDGSRVSVWKSPHANWAETKLALQETGRRMRDESMTIVRKLRAEPDAEFGWEV